MAISPHATAAPTGAGDDAAQVICYHCQRSLMVSRHALTVVCQHCHKAVRLEDFAITGYQARRVIETYGTITVEKNGQIISDKVVCGGLVVRGKVKGSVTSSGAVQVTPEGEIKG